MKNKYWIILGVLLLLLVAAGSYIWANSIMDSLMAYRSPLADNPPAPGVSIGEPLTHRLVIILVDALREDTALNPEVMPFLDEMRQQSAWATMHSQPPSYSAPGWTTILTGAWADINDSQPANPPDNDHVRAFTQDDIFAAADRAGLQAAVSGYAWFEGMLANSGVDAGYYTLGEDNAADIDVMAAAQPWLDTSAYPLVLIHLDQVDYAGHYEGGPRDPNWNAAAGRVDKMIKEIVSSLDVERDTVIVVSDHGQIDRGGHGGQDPVTLIEPFIIAGPAVIPGHYPDIQMVDLAPTVSVLLGTNLPATNQGRVLTEMLAISPEQSVSIREALSAQKYQLLRSYLTEIGAVKAPQPSPETIKDFGLVMEAAKAQRLYKERIPRAIIGLILALIPVGILYAKRSKVTIWLIGGAVLYIAIFNIIYALIEAKTYSLSSVYSADDLITSTAVYASISLLIAWLVTMFILRGFSTPPSSAARLTISLITVTLYLLVLPVLWNYIKNGMFVTWTLPEFSSMFVGFLSIVQCLFVSIIGLLLTGLAALIAKFVPNKKNSVDIPGFGWFGTRS